MRFNGPYGPYGGLCNINFLGTENVFPLVILHKHIGPRIKRIKTFLFKRNNSFYVKFEVKTPQLLNRFSLLFSPYPSKSKLTHELVENIVKNQSFCLLHCKQCNVFCGYFFPNGIFSQAFRTLLCEK